MAVVLKVKEMSHPHREAGMIRFQFLFIFTSPSLRLGLSNEQIIFPWHIILKY